MTDAHYHRGGYATFLSVGDREFSFRGVHPWEVADASARRPYLGEYAAKLRAALEADSRMGVGEIGLDRLKSRVIDPAQRAAFVAQLEVAAELRRPVVLHGAKCWGEVVAACRPYAGRIPAFLFHGFSRSGGLLSEIEALNGFVSVGATLLNDHAVNYCALVKEIPAERLLVETDADYGCDSPGAVVSARRPYQDADASARRPYQEEWELVAAIVRKLAEIRCVGVAELEAVVEANARRFVEALA